LGNNTSFENTSPAVGLDNFDDGMNLGTNTPGAFPRTVIPSTLYNVDLNLNSTGVDNVFYGMWIDWDADGVYEDFYSGAVAVSGGLTVTTVGVNSPAIVSTNLVNIRLRLDDDILGAGDFVGVRTNGEVEDYQFLMNDPLPVEMFYFKAKLVDRNKAKLNWATASELNNEGYEIEHALPSTGVPIFNSIGFVDGAGTTVMTQYYEYEEPNLISGVHYFRLKQVDTDGTYAYTEIKALEVKGGIVEQLFPTILTPASNSLFIKISKNDVYKVKLVTALGQVDLIYTGQIDKNQYLELELDLNKYASGVYFIQVSNATDSFTEKIRIE
jgi:hypothetical protein